MFGFGEVRTHLGVIFSDAFKVFEVLSWISEKNGQKSANIWANTGSTPGVGIPCCSVAVKDDWIGHKFACFAAAKLLFTT